MKLTQAVVAFSIFLGVAVISGYLARSGSDDAEGTIRIDGRERTYTWHVPRGYEQKQPVPLLLALHGRLGTGSAEERLAHLDKVSDAHGFLVVYPNGLDRSWADGRGGTPSDRNSVNDLNFLSALIDKLKSEYNVDRSRIYATGMSNGGFMSGLLACERSDRIAAVAIVGASLSETAAANCHPAKAISVMIVQGTEDPLVPLSGGALGRNGARGVVLSHEAAVQRFVQADHCAGKPAKQHVVDKAGDGTTIDVETYDSCDDGSEVRGYVVNGGGHTWPGGMQYLPAMIVGKTTHNLDGSEVIWEFLSSHTR